MEYRRKSAYAYEDARARTAARVAATGKAARIEQVGPGEGVATEPAARGQVERLEASMAYFFLFQG